MRSSATRSGGGRGTSSWSRPEASTTRHRPHGRRDDARRAHITSEADHRAREIAVAHEGLAIAANGVYAIPENAVSSSASTEIDLPRRDRAAVVTERHATSGRYFDASLKFFTSRASGITVDCGSVTVPVIRDWAYADGANNRRTRMLRKTIPIRIGGRRTAV
jgi:hypothetical protein